MSSELLKFDISKKYKDIHALRDCEVGDYGLLIAGHKFYELSNLINAANYSVMQYHDSEHINNKAYYLKYAILDYNACYDYFEQIIYFAFDFFPAFKTAEEYCDILKNRVKRTVLNYSKNIIEESEFGKDIKDLKNKNEEAKLFFKQYGEYKKFRFDDIAGIADWANNIKHQGGFWFKEILDGTAIIGDNNDFTTRILYPYSVPFKDVLDRLIQQNKKIVEISEWLFSYIFGDTDNVDFEPSIKKFSAGKTQYDKIEHDVTYIEEFDN